MTPEEKRIVKSMLDDKFNLGWINGYNKGVRRGFIRGALFIIIISLSLLAIRAYAVETSASVPLTSENCLTTIKNCICK